MAILGHYLFLSSFGFFTGALCLILAILVLLANPKSKSCLAAFGFNISVAIWSIFYAVMYLTDKDPAALFAVQMLTLGTILLSVIFTHLVLIVLKKDTTSARFLRWDYIAAGILIFFSFTTRLLVAGHSPKMGFISFTDAGPLYFLVPLFLFSNLVFSTVHLIQGIKISKGHEKSRLSLFLIASLIGYIAGTPAFLLVMDIQVKPVTTPLVVLYPIILTYAIIRHRFLDIQKLVKNTLIFTLLFVLLLGCVSAALLIVKEVFSRWIGISETLAQAIAVSLAIVLYGPLKAGLSRMTNPLLFQYSENPEVLFRKLSEDILRYLDPRELAVEVTSRLTAILALERFGLYMRSMTDPHFFELQASTGQLRKKKIPQSRKLIQYLANTGEILVTPIEQGLLPRKQSLSLANLKDLKKTAALELESLGGIAAFPILIRNNLRAVLVVGRKKSDAPWQDKEFRILKSFADHLSLALANAEYAEGIKRSQEEISRRERDASAGILISGVDHEVKNPLHSMSLGLSTLRANLNELRFLTEPRSVVDQRIAKTMESVLQDITEANIVIQHLSDLAERKSLHIEENIRPSLIADKVIKKLNRTNDKILIQSKIPADLMLACDPNALDEILSNLIRNAQQAITDHGQITLEGWQTKTGVVIQVRDTGSGIPREAISKIFEPFFTTKRKKQVSGENNSGMGLFIVKEFMNAMGGSVEVSSHRSAGADFRLIFPSQAQDIKEAA